MKPDWTEKFAWVGLLLGDIVAGLCLFGLIYGGFLVVGLFAP